MVVFVRGGDYVLANNIKKQWLKVLLFVTLIYMVYDGVYVLANSKRLLLAPSKISNSIIPLVTLYNDIFLIVFALLVLYLFNRHQLIMALAVDTRQEVVGLVVGLVFFLFVIIKIQPSHATDAYNIIHTLVTVALLEELIFRGFILNHLIDMGCGKASYLISGMLWGAIYGLEPMIVGGIAPLSAMLPVLFWGMIVGTGAGIIYQRTGSLWLVIYMHAALTLL